MNAHYVSAINNAVCNNCGGNIIIDEKALKSKNFSDGVHIDYFKCPHCGMVYVYLVTDFVLRKDIKRREFISSVKRMKLRAEELKKANEYRINEID